MVPKKLLAELRKKRNKVFLVSAHINLEGDALGAELAVARLLKNLGKKVVVVDQDRVPKEYRFLPDLALIRRTCTDVSYDAAVIVDCSDLSRLGRVARLIKKDKPIINIDHHISNTRFGSINWVESNASCACEMIYFLFKELGVKIKKEEALLLYTGILTDTGSFKYATTSALTHQIASDLVKKGLDVYGIQRHLYESMDFSMVKSFGKIIETLATDRSGKITWLVMKDSVIRKSPALADQTDTVIHFARAVAGAEVALLFKEVKPGREIRVNLRSTGKADVNKLAQVFGGGGHRMASGATLRCSLTEAVRKVVCQAQKGVR